MPIPSRRMQNVGIFNAISVGWLRPSSWSSCKSCRCCSSSGRFGATAVVPPVDASGLISCLVLDTSFFTAKQFKARKGLEAYNQFVCGWVKDVESFVCGSKHVTISRVRHSQRFSDTPLLACIIGSLQNQMVRYAVRTAIVWLVSEKLAHTLQPHLEAAHRLEERTSCTSQACQWTCQRSKRIWSILRFVA